MMGQTMKMPPGLYFVGDPYYVVGVFGDKQDDVWAEVCRQFYSDRTKETIEVDYGGRRAFMTNTEYGDGIYDSNVGSEYCVDAGLIGCTPLLPGDEDFHSKLQRLGSVIYFSDEFTCYERNDHGEIRIGDEVIFTGYDEGTSDYDSEWGTDYDGEE